MRTGLIIDVRLVGTVGYIAVFRTGQISSTKVSSMVRTLSTKSAQDWSGRLGP